jgi:hypothetical protein
VVEFIARTLVSKPREVLEDAFFDQAVRKPLIEAVKANHEYPI